MEGLQWSARVERRGGTAEAVGKDSQTLGAAWADLSRVSEMIE
jgi:hypothetical protein